MDIRVFVIERDYYARQFLKLLLERDPRTRVVGEASSIPEYGQNVGEMSERDVLLLSSTCLPSGIAALVALSGLKRQASRPKLVLLTLGTEELPLQDLVTGVLSGMLDKDEVRDGLASAIVRATEGRVVVTQSIAARLETAPQWVKEHFQVLPPRMRYAKLTERLRRVADLHAEGMSTEQIADELKLAQNSVRTYIRLIHEIIDARDEWQVFMRITALADEIES